MDDSLSPMKKPLVEMTLDYPESEDSEEIEAPPPKSGHCLLLGAILAIAIVSITLGISLGVSFTRENSFSGSSSSKFSTDSISSTFSSTSVSSWTPDSTIIPSDQIVLQGEYQYYDFKSPKDLDYFIAADESLPGGKNGEQELYTPMQISLAQEGLTITSEYDPQEHNTRDYKSGKLLSRYSFLYGHFAVNASFPFGAGDWPAIWLLPSDQNANPWPMGGEIDFAEGSTKYGNNVFASLHWSFVQSGRINNDCGPPLSQRFPPGSDNCQIAASSTSSLKNMGYHMYHLKWYPGELHFSVDDLAPYLEVKLTDDRPWRVPSIPMTLLINLAVGGGFASVPDPTTYPHFFNISSFLWKSMDYQGPDIPPLTRVADYIKQASLTSSSLPISSSVSSSIPHKKETATYPSQTLDRSKYWTHVPTTSNV